MTDREFIASTIMDNLLKVAKVNINTGEYIFYKRIPTQDEARCLRAATITEYIQNIIDFGLLHPDDTESYLHHTDLDYLRYTITHQKRKMVHSFRRKVNNAYMWVTFEIIIPKDFSLESHPWVVFSWKEADSDSCDLEDALKTLSAIYHKILKINLTADTCQEVKVYSQELTPEMGHSLQISEWLRRFAECGNVHPEDLKEYYAFTDMNFLKSYFHSHSDCIRCRYRRMTNGSFRWVNMELLPSIEYTDSNQVLMLYIRDVHDSYISDLQYRKDLERVCSSDTLTGLHNRFAYNQVCDTFSASPTKPSMAVAFADLNGLKYINDHFGHVKGDQLLQHFTRMLTEEFGPENCYRISGDEFIVLLPSMEREAFLSQCNAFQAKIHGQRVPIASLGYHWEAAPSSLESVVHVAEVAMYADKQWYYNTYPQYARK